MDIPHLQTEDLSLGHLQAQGSDIVDSHGPPPITTAHRDQFDFPAQETVQAGEDGTGGRPALGFELVKFIFDTPDDGTGQLGRTDIAPCLDADAGGDGVAPTGVKPWRLLHWR